MSVIETPGLLIEGEENYYLLKFRELFEGYNEIIIPEQPDKKIIIFTKDDSKCKHFWRGGEDKDRSELETRWRAYRLLWIRFLVETQTIRRVFRDKKKGNIVFASTELGFAVVVADLGNRYKLITSFVATDPMRWHKQIERYEQINL